MPFYFFEKKKEKRKSLRCCLFFSAEQIFRETCLAAEASAYSSIVFTHCVNAFSSRHWSVRNAASLTFAVLVERLVGYKNQVESSKGMVSSTEFFHRYPDLHRYMLKELGQAASDQKVVMQLTEDPGE